MTNFDIFTDDHLLAAEARCEDGFTKAAEHGLLHAAACSHIQLTAVRAELARRASANLKRVA